MHFVEELFKAVLFAAAVYFMVSLWNSVGRNQAEKNMSNQTFQTDNSGEYYDY